MTQTKIIFFDIDGTLIDMNRKKISEKMLETLIRLQKKGLNSVWQVVVHQFKSHILMV
ncbi:HAD hydrolase family protein [Enterococcus cecorum]